MTSAPPSPRTAPAGPVLVEGGGVAGIATALDLAAAGRPVHLVEQAPLLGGQVRRLDKLYPTDHCAFCPLWTEIRRLREFPGVTLHLASRIAALERTDRGLAATIETQPPPIDPARCIACGRCVGACPPGAVLAPEPHTYPPVFATDPARCDGCGRCVGACPTGAIALERPVVRQTLTVAALVRATGFVEASLSPRPEFGHGTHPDILTSLEFEARTAEAGPHGGRIARHDGRPARNVAFIQCSGARDERLLSGCSAVCCMHALKQATWVKRRDGAVECTIFYTDLRTVGRDYHTYARRATDEAGVRLLRGRPGLIHALPGGDGIAVQYEDTLTRRREIRRFDLVVLNGNLRPTRREKDPAAGEGEACGFAAEPADVAQAAWQGAAAAARILAGEGPWPA